MVADEFQGKHAGLSAGKPDQLLDVPAMFYSPERFRAQLLWFGQGALEYCFIFPHMDQMEIEWLELSFEAWLAIVHKNPGAIWVLISFFLEQLQNA